MDSVRIRAEISLKPPSPLINPAGSYVVAADALKTHVSPPPSLRCVRGVGWFGGAWEGSYEPSVSEVGSSAFA